MKKILFYAIYPAPYRIETINLVAKDFSSIVFCEKSNGSSRDKNYFVSGDFYCLDNKKGADVYKEKIKRISDFDLVFIYDFASKNAVSLINRCIKNRVPYILNSDGVLLFKHGNFIKDFIKRHVIKHASACVASGELAKQYFIKYGANKEKIYIHNFSSLHKNQILNYIPTTDDKNAIRKKFDLPINKTIVLGVGRFIPLKQYHFLLYEWKNVSKHIILLLVGGGVMKEEYELIVKQNNLSNVIIRDFYSFEDLQLIFQASDLFVHPTSYDCWGLVINEAMANGIPVISSDMCVAGLELIEKGVNGDIVHFDDFKSFIDSVKMLASDEKKRNEMSKNNILKIQNFTIEQMADVHKHVIYEIIGK